MLRLHFTATDLLRTRFAAAPAPLAELSLALMSLRCAPGGSRVRNWQQRTWRRIGPRARPFAELVPSASKSPRFLDPILADLPEALDAVRAVAPRTARQEFRRVFPSEAPVTTWVRALDDHDRTAWRALDDALEHAYRDVIGEQWAQVCASHQLDLAARSATLAADGVATTLVGLYPGSRWDGTTLVLPSPHERDCYLQGRGLVLLGSAYWLGDPAVTLHPDGSAVLIYPSVVSIPLGDERVEDHSLVALLGQTRAAALQSLTRPHSTSELAAELGVSVSSASEHAATLRRSGLITTDRAGRSVQHACTPLGLRLLAGV